MSKNSKLRALAAKLPSVREVSLAGVPLVVRKQIHGSSILAHNPKAVDMQGNRIEADRFYTSEAPKLVDHFEKLKAAYTLNGEKGVQQYLDSVAKLMEQAMADLELKKHTNENKQPAN